MQLWMSWSSGKDSAFALQQIRGEFEISALLTTVSEAYGRVSMHGVRLQLLEAQAERLGLELRKIAIPTPCSNDQYEARMSAAIGEATREGVSHMGFGDLFLEDIRKYREKMLSGTGIEPVFPLWSKPTAMLAEDMIASGLKAVVTCVDPRKLPGDFAGRQFDRSFLAELPAEVDPCGENGEFHTFVYDSPIFSSPIPIEVGETVERDGFIFADVLPKD